MRFLEFILGTLIVWLVGFVITALLEVAFAWFVDGFNNGEMNFMLEVIGKSLHIIVYTGLTTFVVLAAFLAVIDSMNCNESHILWLNIIIAVALGLLATIKENQYELITIIIMNIACVVAYIIALVCTPESLLELIRKENREKQNKQHQ